MCCPSCQYGQPIGNLWLNTRRRGSFRSYFEVASIECEPPPHFPHFDTRIPASILDWWLVFFNGCHYYFTWLYICLFNCSGMIYLRWQWWWRRRERSLSWLIQWHLTDPPIDQMNFPQALHHHHQHHRYFHNGPLHHYHHHHHRRCHWILTNHRAWIVMEHPFLDSKICYFFIDRAPK